MHKGRQIAENLSKWNFDRISLGPSGNIEYSRNKDVIDAWFFNTLSIDEGKSRNWRPI